MHGIRHVAENSSERSLRKSLVYRTINECTGCRRIDGAIEEVRARKTNKSKMRNTMFSEASFPRKSTLNIQRVTDLDRICI